MDRERHESIIHALESRVGLLESERDLSSRRIASKDAEIEELRKSLRIVSEENRSAQGVTSVARGGKEGGADLIRL
jgi:hypothetical protein